MGFGCVEAQNPYAAMSALCRRCRMKLPEQMRAALEEVPSKDAWAVSRALRAAANYFDVHFQSVRNFGGGRRRR